MDFPSHLALTPNTDIILCHSPRTVEGTCTCGGGQSDPVPATGFRPGADLSDYLADRGMPYCARATADATWNVCTAPRTPYQHNAAHPAPLRLNSPRATSRRVRLLRAELPQQFTTYGSDTGHAEALATHTRLVLDFVTQSTTSTVTPTFPHTPITPAVHGALAAAVSNDPHAAYALVCVADSCARLSQSLGGLLGHPEASSGDLGLKGVVCGPAHPKALAEVALLPPAARDVLEKRDGTLVPGGPWAHVAEDHRLSNVYAAPNVSCGILFTQLLIRGDDLCSTDLATTHDEFFYYEHNFARMTGTTTGGQWYTAWWQALHESLLHPPVAQRAIFAAIGSLYTAYKTHLEMAVQEAGLGDAATHRMLDQSREGFLRQQLADSGVLGYLPQENHHTGSPRQTAWDLSMTGPGTDVIDTGRDIAGSAELGTSMPQLAEGRMNGDQLAQVYARLCAVMDDATLRDDLGCTSVLLADLNVWHLSNQRHPILEMMLIGRHATSDLYFSPAPLESYWDEALRMTGTPTLPGPAKCAPLTVTHDNSLVTVTPCLVFQSILDRLGPVRNNALALIDRIFGFIDRHTLDDIGTFDPLRSELAAHFMAIALDGPTEAGRHFVCHLSHHAWTVERFCEMAMQGNYAFYANQPYIGCDRSDRPVIE
ncbi:hypothetical protein ACWGJ2_20450 [Streptomyces sp. NPDC054796]